MVGPLAVASVPLTVAAGPPADDTENAHGMGCAALAGRHPCTGYDHGKACCHPLARNRLFRDSHSHDRARGPLSMGSGHVVVLDLAR